MNAQALLDRLDGVRRYGKGWRARCPSCSGKRRDTLAVTEVDDGRVLLHCFHGCTPLDVVQAVGLTLGDLFPERIRSDTPEERKAARLAAREAGWRAALVVLDAESLVVEVAAEHVACGGAMSDDDRARLHQAADRISSARQTLCDQWSGRR